MLSEATASGQAGGKLHFRLRTDGGGAAEEGADALPRLVQQVVRDGDHDQRQCRRGEQAAEDALIVTCNDC